MKWWLITIGGLFSCAYLPAQAFYWQQYELPDALEEVLPTSIFESDDGLLWLASSQGLLSFDGTSFQLVPRSDGSIVQAHSLYEDREGVLWVGYENGDIDRMIGGNLQPWEPEEGLPAVAITGFAEDNEGRIWFATYGEGVYLIDGRHLYNINTDDGLPGNDVYTITNDPEGNIWLGTDSGISSCSFSAGKKSITNISRKEGLNDEIVRVLLPDAEGNFWVGTHDKGVSYYDQSTKTFSVPLPQWENGVINDLALREGQWLYIGTESKGGWRLSLTDHRLEALSESDYPGQLHSDSKIYAVHTDREGGLWIATSKDGLLRTNESLQYVNAPDLNIQAILLGSSEQLWLGTDKGLYFFGKNGLLNRKETEQNLNVVSLYEDGYGNLWLGTFGDGLYILNPETGRQRHFGMAQGLVNGSVLSIAGRNGRVLLASLGGVKELTFTDDPLTASRLEFKKIDGLRTDFIYQIVVDANGTEWYATDGEGVAVRQADSITHLRQQITTQGDSIDLRTVYSLTLPEEGHPWLNTPRGGLYRFTGSVYDSPRIEALTSLGEIAGLSPAGQQIMVVAHTKGLTLIHALTGQAVNFRLEEIGAPQFVPALNAITHDQSGKVWIGGFGGLLIYQPLHELTASRSRTVLHSVSVYPTNKAEPEGRRFSHQENILSFDFLGIWYTDPSAVRYRYQLEGYDPDWIETLDEQLIYSKLPAGEYTFRVASMAGKDWRGADEKSYQFSIAPPFWWSWWFILIVGGSLALVTNYLVRWRDARLQRIALLQKESIISQYEALKSQINPHFLFNSFNTLIAMIEEDSPDAVAYTERLSDLFRSVLQYRDRETIPISEELALLKNYTYLMKQRFGNKIKIKIDLPTDSVFIVPLSLQLLVENAIKHNVVSTSRPLKISINLVKDDQYICVWNNRQPKLNQISSTGFGLSSLAARYALLGGYNVLVEKENDYFRVCLPVLVTEIGSHHK